MVEHDMRKEFFKYIADADFDLLLLDLIDERFNLWRGQAGQLYTLSSELVGSGFLAEAGEGAEIQSGSEDFWLLWEQGWSYLVDKLNGLGQLERLRVNRVFWSEATRSGLAFPRLYSASRIRAANELLKRMYARMANDIPEAQFLTFTDSELMAADEHKWGLSPFHYVEQYYRAAIAQLVTASTAVATATNRSEAAVMELPAAYDLDAWKSEIHAHTSFEGIDASTWGDGIHRIGNPAELTVDLYVNGLERLKSAKAGAFVLIELSGAVSNRQGKKAPFFSGIGIARSLDLPLIAVSDPTLSMDSEVPLAWYAGNASMPDLQSRLARLLERISTSTGARLLIFGGSGAGFAALQLSSVLQCPVSVLVWNPQTAISDYVPNFVAQYITAAFPQHAGAVVTVLKETPDAQPRLLKSILEQTGVQHDVRVLPVSDMVEVIYLQNSDDWHVPRHVRPYMASRNWEQCGKGYISKPVGNVGIHFGQWGAGHAAPPKEVIEQVIRTLVAGATVEEVIQMLETSSNSESGMHVIKQSAITAKAWIAGGKVHAECTMPSARVKLKYAYYLLDNGQRCAVRWYEPDPAVSFDIPEHGKQLEIVAFCRDELGHQSSVRVGVMAANFDANSEKNNGSSDQSQITVQHPHEQHEIVERESCSSTEVQEAKEYWSSLDVVKHDTYLKQQPWSVALAELFAQHAPERIFEFGCNAGKNLIAIRERLPEAYLEGVDINQKAIEIARSFGLRAFAGDQAILETYPDRCFDICFTVSVLDHLPEPSLVIQELARMSSKGLYFLEPWLGTEGRVVRNFNRRLNREIETTPYSYSWDIAAMVKQLLPGWQLTVQPMPLPTNLGPHYVLFKLLPILHSASLN